MRIAVTYTGKDDKQQSYLDWLHSLAPQSVLEVLSYDKNNAADLRGIDGLVLTGGGDVDPELYGGETGNPLIKAVDRRRDDFEFSLLDTAFANRLPVLGICRGLQLVNVYFGGTLYADLQSAGFKDHAALNNVSGENHSVHIAGLSVLSEIVGSHAGEVNSFHHQGVRKLGDGLIVSSHSVDGVIESMERKSADEQSFLMLVQWHPERMKDKGNPLAANIGGRFINELKKIITV